MPALGGEGASHQGRERERKPDMGLRGDAGIVGYAELKPERHPARRSLSIEQWAELARLALADAGIASSEVDGLVTPAIRESASFVPSTVA
ncbi:MAG: hypothetical protein AB7U18_28995, partial [Dehalococcoidia bacterium]